MRVQRRIPSKHQLTFLTDSPHNGSTSWKNQLKASRDGITVNPFRSHQRESLVFQMTTPARKEKMDKEITILTANALEFSPKCNDVAFTAKQTYNCRDSYGAITAVMHKATCFLNTSAADNLIQSSFLPKACKKRIKRDSLPILRKATKQPLPVTLDELILLHINLSDL